MVDGGTAEFIDRMRQIFLAQDGRALFADDLTAEAGRLLSTVNWYAATTVDDALDALPIVLFVAGLHAQRAHVLAVGSRADLELAHAEALFERVPTLAALVLPVFGDVETPEREIVATLAKPSPLRGPGPATRWVTQAVARAVLEGKLTDPFGLLDTVRQANTGVATGAVDDLTAHPEATTPPSHDLSHEAGVDRLRYEADNLFAQADNESDAQLMAKAVATYRRVCDATPLEHPKRPEHLCEFGQALYRHAIVTGSPEVFEKAEEVLREALQSTPADSPYRVFVLAELGYTLLMRYEHQAMRAALPEAERLLRAAVQAEATDVRYSVNARLNLAQVLRRAYEQSRDPQTLAEMIELGRGALADNNVSALRATILNALGSALLIRFEAHGDEDAGRESVELLEQALRLVPQRSRSRIQAACNLANAYLRAFERYGDSGRVENAIALLREVGDRLPACSVEQALRHAILAHCLLRRYIYTGDHVSLDQCIEAYQTALKIVPAGHHERPTWLASLGAAFLQRHEDGDVDSLDLAIRVLREAWSSAGPDYWNRDLIASNLSSAIFKQVIRQWDPALAQEATTLRQNLVDTTEPGHPYRPGRQLNLAMSLVHRAAFTASMSDLQAAEQAAEDSLHELPSSHPMQAQSQQTLAGIRTLRSRLTGRTELWQQAVGLYRAAASLITAPISRRVETAVAWGRISVEYRDYESATEAYSAAVGLLDQLAWRGLDRSSRERLLQRVEGLATDAAACALQIGRPEHAVELLEQGRGVLLAQSIEARSAYDTLRRQASELADGFAAVQEALDGPTQETPNLERQADERIKLARRRDELLARIRQLPGLDEFLKPPRFAILRLAAAQGPVVILNVSPVRCDALIITLSGVEVCPLPTITAATVAKQVEAFINAGDAITRLTPGAPDAGEVLVASRATIRKILGWAWDSIAEPTLRSLGLLDQSPSNSALPRLWWCPTGMLTFLPWHAATASKRPAETQPRCVLDYAMSSYTPTLRALIAAWEKPKLDTPPVGLSVVMPHTRGHRDLPAAEREADSLCAIDPRTTRLIGPEATRDEVISALRHASWVHFACHGEQKLTAPSDAELLLHDAPLSVLDISRLRLSNAELAVLSACETSRGSTVLPDEAITMAAAMQLAGYRHVIGTLWAAGDNTAGEMAEQFYSNLVDPTSHQPDSTNCAIALHRSMRTLREGARHPWTWAAFVHIGP